MQNLIKFLVRNGAVIVFLVLEFVCLRLIVTTNQRQGEIYHRTSMQLTGAINQRTAAMTAYWELRNVNDSLRNEIARMRTQLVNRMMSTAGGPGSADTITSRYDIVAARVIQNSVVSRNNYLTLDRGSSSGIDRGMGVLGPAGPLGIVVAATPNYAKVMSVLNNNSRISAAIRNKQYFGSLVWRGFNPTRMRLEAVPKHAQIMPGDTVVTSGYSNKFPPDIVIGTIDTLWLPRGSNFYTIDVNLEQDLSRIYAAYVVKDLALDELRELDSLITDE